MVRSTRGLLCLIIVATTVTHIAECGFRKLQSKFSPKRTSLQTCHTCLLKYAGAKRLILMKKSISEVTITITYLIKGPSSFYYNVEVFALEWLSAEPWKLKIIYLPMKKKGKQKRTIRLRTLNIIYA
ncbi:hypothetical protein ABG067_000002 [Albugo candida]